METCPECYCAVELKNMSMHLLWHGGIESGEVFDDSPSGGIVIDL
jgi:hypothetical protein